jgi:predicted PurR-regulated permease PerM
MMFKSLVVSVFSCLEYGIAFLFVASLAFTLTRGLDSLVPSLYDYSTEQDLVDTLREDYESGKITSQESRQILRIYQNDGARLERLRTRILDAVSICISAVVMVLLFKKYRSLRFRKRFRDYFFPAKT